MDRELLKAAILALGIDVPIIKAEIEKGQVVIWTRNGKQTWTPPASKPARSPRKKKGTKDDES